MYTDAFYIIHIDYIIHVLCQSVSSVQSLSRVRLFATPCIAARQASLSITNSYILQRLAVDFGRDKVGNSI